ncbi:MAG: hypothetical protein ACPL1Y_02695 [Thermoplasmata archaeon]
MIDRRLDKTVAVFGLIVGTICALIGYFLIWHDPIPSFLAFVVVFLFILTIYYYAGWGLKWRGMVFGIFGAEEEEDRYMEYVEKHVDTSERGRK